jgi:pimeloyl-ACP methyl ester carboxylesterase
MENPVRGGVLILPGGRPESSDVSRPWQLANQRMALLARSLRRRLGPGVRVTLVRYRLRGWNPTRFDALRDAETALERMRGDFPARQIAVVGHSMGGRVAAHLSASGDVGSVVALAPWWPRTDADLVPAGCRLLVIHGTADTRTDPGASRAQTRRAADRGVDAQWVPVEGAGHYLVRGWRQWHRLTADFVAATLSDRLPEP